MSSKFGKNFIQSLTPVLIGMVFILALGAIQIPQLNYLKKKSQNISTQTVTQEVEAEKLRLSLFEKLPAFGFDNLFADWVFMKFLQYFGDDEARQLTSYELSLDYFDIIIDRDPRFWNAYYFLSTSGSLYAAMPERSIALMEKGLQQLSPQVPAKSYYIWRQKGVDQLLFLGDTEASSQSFATAAEWASVYSDPDSKRAEESSRKTSQFLASKPDVRSAQESAWTMVLTNTDDRTRKFAIQRIKAMGGKVSITPSGNFQVDLTDVKQ